MRMHWLVPTLGLTRLIIWIPKHQLERQYYYEKMRCIVCCNLDTMSHVSARRFRTQVTHGANGLLRSTRHYIYSAQISLSHTGPFFHVKQLLQRFLPGCFSKFSCATARFAFADWSGCSGTGSMFGISGKLRSRFRNPSNSGCGSYIFRHIVSFRPEVVGRPVIYGPPGLIFLFP